MKKYVCKCCGSENIQIRQWINPNTNKQYEWCDEARPECWCEECQDITTWTLAEGADVAKHKKYCAVCGREIASGYVFDGKTWLCPDECVTKFFDNDEGCVEILLDEGRLEWRD